MVFGARVVLEGTSEKWLEWDYILNKLLIFANAVDIGYKRKTKATEYSNWSLSNWMNYGAIYQTVIYWGKGRFKTNMSTVLFQTQYL